MLFRSLRRSSRPSAAAPASASASAPAPAPAPTYLPLTLPASAVLTVDTADALGQLLAHFTGLGLPPRVVGIDAEWSCAPRRGELRLQWLQLASRERVFLLDVPALCAAHAGALQGTLGKLLASPHVLKVGFGLGGDLKELRAAHPALAECAATVFPVLELRDAWLKHERSRAGRGRAAAAAAGRPAKPAQKKGGRGLSALCEQMLGAPLDKRMQLSNWARRPLAPQQRAYAALDAHCLVLLHAALGS